MYESMVLLSTHDYPPRVSSRKAFFQMSAFPIQNTAAISFGPATNLATTNPPSAKI